MRYSGELACFSTKEIKSEPLIKTHAMFDFDTKKKKKRLKRQRYLRRKRTGF